MRGAIPPLPNTLFKKKAQGQLCHQNTKAKKMVAWNLRSSL